MITLITGVPGHGKTLYAVQLILEALKANPDRLIFTDINGINIDGVTTVGIDHCWFDTPDGSLCVYDEAQQRWPTSGGAGLSNDPTISRMDTHRHTAHDLIIITQQPTLIHHHVRKFVGRHCHVKRVASSKNATIFSRDEAFNPKDTRDLSKCDKKVFKYPKKNFALYKSASEHNYKFQMPTRLKLILFVVLLILFYLGNSVTRFFTDDEEISVSTVQASPTSTVVTPATAEDVPPDLARFIAASSAASSPVASVVSGCLVFDDRCRCYSDAGRPLLLSLEQCHLVYAEMPRGISVLGSDDSDFGGDTSSPGISSEDLIGSVMGSDSASQYRQMTAPDDLPEHQGLL